MTKTFEKQLNKRNILSTFFITLLVGLAYQEMVTVVTASFIASGFILKELLLIGVFFFVSTRFFIGNQLHLISNDFLELPGVSWLYDVMVITVQAILLILLAGFTSIDINHKSSFGFVEILIILYTIDILWILSQKVWKKIDSKLRKKIPWKWAILNICLGTFVIILTLSYEDIYSTTGLIWLFVLELFAFIVDVFVLDLHGIISLSAEQ